MDPHVLVLVALLLAVIEVARTRAQSLMAWAMLCLTVFLAMIFAQGSWC